MVNLFWTEGLGGREILSIVVAKVIIADDGSRFDPGTD